MDYVRIRDCCRMEIETAKSAGFCFGVKRAVEAVYEKEKEGGHIVTYGPIVHNDEVVNELKSLGVEVANTEEDLDALINQESNTTIIIRAHGIPRRVYEKLEASHLEVVDATCPFVKRIHNVVTEESEKGFTVLIVGNPGHPEVEGIKGWCNGPVFVLENIEQARLFDKSKDAKYCIVAQTTYNYNKFQEIVELLKNSGYNVNVVNTICNATTERQTQTRELAKRADVMLVIGGKHSSNTTKLYEICCSECKHTYFVQTLDDLHLELPKAVRLVGITAGASTPNKLIEEVQNYVRINF